jgi:hypothetical protein
LIAELETRVEQLKASEVDMKNLFYQEGVDGLTLGAQIAPQWVPTVGAKCGPDTNQ